jgi:hypothetical protein
MDHAIYWPRDDCAHFVPLAMSFVIMLLPITPLHSIDTYTDDGFYGRALERG